MKKRKRGGGDQGGSVTSPSPLPTSTSVTASAPSPTWRGSTFIRTRTCESGPSNMFLSFTPSTAVSKGGQRKWSKCECQSKCVTFEPTMTQKASTTLRTKVILHLFDIESQ